VTNFLQDSSQEYIDAAAFETEQQLRSHILDLVVSLIFGNAVANDKDFDGLEVLATKNRINQALNGVVPTALSTFDAMIDKSNRAGGASHRRAFLMSPEMLSKLSALLTNVRLNQGLNGAGLTQIEVNGGWRMSAYRDIPIVESTSMSPVEVLSSTVTLAGVTTGGGLSDGAHNIYIAPVTDQGEQVAKQTDITLAGGGAVQRIKITLNAGHSTDGQASAYYYKIYGKLGAGATTTIKLLKVVSAFTYDSDGAITGENGVSGSEIYVGSMTPESSVPTHMQADPPLFGSAPYPENIVLWDMDSVQGLGQLVYTNTGGDKFKGLVTTKKLAETDDWMDMLVKSYCALAPKFGDTTVISRGWKVG
jgi:hypothetical protein